MDLEDLVIAAQSGDAGTFGVLVQRFQDMAFGGAYAWLGDADEARDVAQDAFIEAWQSLHTLREPAAFPGWFRLIVRKHADRHLRRRKPTVPTTVLESLPSRLPDPLAIVEQQEVREVVRAAVASLPETQRLPLTLFHLEGRRQKDVAAFLELPVSTVRKRIFDARRALQRKVVHMVEEDLKQRRPSKDDSFARQVDYWVAITARDVSAVAGLLDKDPSLLETTSDRDVAPELRSEGWNVPAATWAAHVGDSDMLAFLLDRGAKTVGQGHNGDGLLHVAAMTSRADIVRLLLERQVDLDARGSCKQTALHRAIIRGEPEIVDLLLDGGADPDATDEAGRTAADWAALKGRDEIMTGLLDRGARPSSHPLRRPRRVQTRQTPTRSIPSAVDALGYILDADGAAENEGPVTECPLLAAVDRAVPAVLETGIKAADFLAPFPRGGQIGIDAGLGTGKLLLTAQIARNVIETYDGRVVYVDITKGEANGRPREWESFVADGKLLTENSILVLAQRDDATALARAAETGLSLAEDLRRAGHEVLFYVDTPVTRVDGVLDMLRTQGGYGSEAAITICYLGHIPYGIGDAAFDFLDTRIRMDVRRARDGRFPAIDLELSRSRLHDDSRMDPAHHETVERARPYIRALATHNTLNPKPMKELLDHVSEDDQVVAERLLTRARLLDAFLTQPYHGTEQWIGKPGETVALPDTVEGVRRIIDGDFDDVPVDELNYVGALK